MDHPNGHFRLHPTTLCGHLPHRLFGHNAGAFNGLRRASDQRSSGCARGGSTPEAAEFVDQLYGSIITAGTHRASSLKVAEAAKVIENTQRDLNIALINELALIFERMGLDIEEVLAVAHREFKAMGAEQIRSLGKQRHVLFDVKNTLPKSAVTARL